ncbi:MAG: SURF1 family protein [Gemmatimonadetes bacterium]|nr:SURF1 family protein [Gemmatimonadota bacterium]
MARPAAFVLVALALAALFVRLGVWQLDRAAQRQAANARVASLLAQPFLQVGPADLRNAAAAKRLAWRRAAAEGRYAAEGEVVIPGRAYKGSPGVHLLTPLLLEGGGGVSILVNRGWVPSPDASTVKREAYREQGRVRVCGVLRPPSAPEARALLTGRAAAVPVVLEQLAGARSRPFPIRSSGPELTGGPHRSYAVQWFSFAAIALIGAGAYVRSRARHLDRSDTS